MAADITISIAGKIGEMLVAPTGRHFGYLIQHNRKVEKLKEQLENLERQRKGLERSIVAAKMNVEEIKPEVEEWMKNVDGLKQEATKFLKDDVNMNKRCFGGWFPDLITRYQIGKEAKKKTMVVVTKLQEAGKFSNISNRAPPLGIMSMSSQHFVDYKTSKLAMTKVMEALKKEEKINLVGIHGMGGVGKTTLVKEICKKAKEDKLFDEVVMAVVSQTLAIKKIQDQIADMLGLTFTETSDIGRASKLCARLKGVNKILIVLDDVWARFDVEAVGIPFGNDHKGCKIIITTRREQVCNTMGIGSQTTKIVHLDVLSEEESWDLFRRTAGDAIDSPTLKGVAKDIAKECGGLPVAIVTVGKAMKGRDPDEWKEAVHELKASIPRNIEGVDDNVFRCVKFSYDYLRDEEAKTCFLFCSLFPEDYEITIETLVRYAVGLEIFKNVVSVQDARHRANLVINNLKASSLLIAGDKQGCVKMHDVVRDVGLSIGSDKYLVRAGVKLKEWPYKEILDKYMGISLIGNQLSVLPIDCERSKLQIMLLQGNYNLAWSPSFFEGWKTLRVLDLSNTAIYYFSKIYSLPLSFGNLSCLQTLVLEGMKFGDTTALGLMKALEVLNVVGCIFCESPSIAIRHLTNLRLLDMSFCACVDDRGIFEANMISCLSRLEELYLDGTLMNWECGNELNSLRRLTVLTICTQGIPDDFVFPDLEVFTIRKDLQGLECRPNYLVLDGSTTSSIARWQKIVKMLLKKTNHLDLLRIDVANIVPMISHDGGEDLNMLETLKVSSCDEFEYLIDATIEEWGIALPDNNREALSNLKELTLYNLRSFKGICNGVLPSTASLLLKLSLLRIGWCNALSKVILPFNLFQRLQELEELYIYYCKTLEHVFDVGQILGGKIHDDDDDLQLLSSLRVLYLNNLPGLKHIWKCPNQLQVHLHYNLRRVHISFCKGLKNLFDPCVAPCLQQMEKLEVSSCKGLEEIVAKENKHDPTKMIETMVFKSLRELELKWLPKLKGFCMGSFLFQFPSLEVVTVFNSTMMETFTVAATSSSGTPKLKAINVDEVEIMLPGADLNTVIQNHFKEKHFHQERKLSSRDASRHSYQQISLCINETDAPSKVIVY